WTAPLMIYSIGAVSLWLALHALWRPSGDVGPSGPSLVDRLRMARPLLARIVVADVAALALAYLLYLPIILLSGLGAILANKLVRPVPWPQFVRLLPPFLFELGVTWSSPLSTLTMLWIVALFSLALFGMARERRVAPSFAFAAVGACLGLFLFSHAHPFVRVWLFFVPLFLLAVGRGLVRLWRRARLTTSLDPAWGAMTLAVAVTAVALSTHAA